MKNQKTFLTANTYFGRLKALDLPRRNYVNIDDMNQSMVDAWNKVVEEDDLVYHLGYFAHDSHTTNDMLELLNGNIYFFNNGTDIAVGDVIPIYDNIMLYEGQVLEIHDKNAILAYYPFEIWDNPDTYHFYADERLKTDLTIQPNRMNIAFDSWNRPVNIDECIEYINEFKNNK